MKTLLLKIKQSNISWWFILTWVFWLGLALYGVFSDLNVSIQEGTNIYDELMPKHNYIYTVNSLKWFFGGKGTGHQYLFHLMIYGSAKIFRQTSGLSLVLLGRIISIVFSLLSVIVVRYFVQKNLPKHNPESVTLLQMFHPLFFFYSMQAEPYALLFFWTILHLILYFKLQSAQNPWQILAFGTVTILGYYTHFYFLFILFAEILTELYKFLKKQKILIWPFGLMFCLTPLLLWQIPMALNSSLKYFIDGYFAFSPGLCLKILGTFFGLTPLLFSDILIYILTVFLLGGSALWLIKNRQAVPLVISIFYFLLLGAFIFFNTVSAAYGWTYPTMRHYVGIVLPWTIVFGTFLLQSSVRVRSVLCAIVLGVFLLTDILSVGKAYKPDGLSATEYLRENLSPEAALILCPSWTYYSIEGITEFLKTTSFSSKRLSSAINIPGGNGTIDKIITAALPNSTLYFAYFSEYILGLEEFDQSASLEGLQDMLNNPQVQLLKIEEFTNLKIYTFVKL
jgi:hypothetical protein